LDINLCNGLPALQILFSASLLNNNMAQLLISGTFTWHVNSVLNSPSNWS